MAKYTGSIHRKDDRRGRLSSAEGQLRIRYVLRHLDDPIELQKSPLSRTAAVEKMARDRYPNGIVARGRALHDFIVESLQEVENELDGHSGVARLKAFIVMTREGKGVKEAGRAIGVTREYASRKLKRTTVELLAKKLLFKLH